jgi:ribosomal protein S3AE
MPQKKQTKVVTKRRKFFEVEVPLTRTKIELTGNSIESLDNQTIKLDLTRQLRGKSVEAVVKIKVKDEKAIAEPIKLRLLPYFIRRMIRKRISYIEDSFQTPSQESMIKIKPFIITRKKVSRVVRKTIRNQTKNWIEDYIAERTDHEIFEDVLSNRLQKPLSIRLKKTYPLSLCEIRVLEIIRKLNPEEKPKIEKKEEEKIEEETIQPEIEDEIKKQEVEEAEREIKQTQKKAAEKEKQTKPKKTTAKKSTTKTKSKIGVTEGAKPLAKG